MVERLFRVVFSRKSIKRLKNIGEYYKENASDETAKKVRLGIVTEAKKLKRYPESNPLMPGTEDVDYKVRYTKTWSYKIIYRIFPTKFIVRILTIRHDKQDRDKILEDLE